MPGSALTAGATTLLAIVHVGGLLFGGGFAVASDRGSRAAARAPGPARAAQLVDLARTHPLVMRGLWVSVGSGAAIFALHAQTYLTSGIFWLKMALVVALLGNGLIMQVAERDAREAADGSTDVSEAPAAVEETAWRRLRGSAIASTALWAATAAAGVLVQGAR